MEVDWTLFELHQQNVTAAIKYRAHVLGTLLSTVISRDQEA